MNEHYRRLLQMADDVFSVKSDPTQLDVDQEVIKRLQKIHPATVSEYSDEKGPAAWLILIPTTEDLMRKFIDGSVTERELYDQTPLKAKYDAIYLSSALVLEEYRRKGIIKDLALKAIEAIRKDHPIQYLFTWPFTSEGDLASDKIAELTSLPLLKRKKR
ncbi:MAG TPA: hypothetical protein VK212_07935 [Lentimicrobium sp.]|nr:hypothetical protein [Lentimicrobium sp.]